ncbi:IctB family putative bicarbonate transporter [Synechococcus sp. PCC 6312]|uniref:IctB family putative bicarbonate transporter n=1 Tax=Synechococcus sp. (strain ATCC 27167 / PCC 6312) TaxID=195253 RepID=UPI00029EF4B2|nr:IctB family putative bicarbonate transporter [Synechococcus sp. PCC 6312]AFY61442.1 putative bicarbonate transporter, IctB family [Synechococcus sp. PCC 6312]
MTLWQQITLGTIPWSQWRQKSLLGQWMGLIQAWQRGSVLWPWVQGLGGVLAGLILILAPFVPSGMIGVVLFAGVLFWGLWTVSTAPENRFTPIHSLVALYWSIAVVATAFSPVKAAAFQGLIKLSLYMGFFALAERVMRSPKWRSGLITIYLLTALVVSIYGVRQWIFGADALATWTDPQSELANTTRVYSYLGNPNLLAGYLLPAIPLSLASIFAWRGWLPKLLGGVMLGLSTSSLIFTFSRGGWLGLVVSLGTLSLLLLYWLLPRLPRFWQFWAFPALLGGLAVLVVAAMILVPAIRGRVLSIFAERNDSSNNFRINVWAAVQDMIRDRPILGIGPGNEAFNKVYPLYQRPGYTALSAYSIFLELLVEAGTIGFAAFVWFLLTTLTQAWQTLNHLRKMRHPDGFWLMAALATMLGMLTHGLVDTIWYRPEVATLWWLMIAVVASYPAFSQPQPLTNPDSEV